MRRRALGISQAKLAQLISMNRVTVGYWECGHHDIPPQRAKAVDAALNVLEASYKVAAEAARQAGQG